MSEQIRRIAVIGGSRIPFCRSNTIFADKTNMDMLSASIQGLVDRFGLEGMQLDEVVAGAGLHTRGTGTWRGKHYYLPPCHR